jgi:hypothetical protein
MLLILNDPEKAKTLQSGTLSTQIEPLVERVSPFRFLSILVLFQL